MWVHSRTSIGAHDASVYHLSHYAKALCCIRTVEILCIPYKIYDTYTTTLTTPYTMASSLFLQRTELPLLPSSFDLASCETAGLSKDIGSVKISGVHSVRLRLFRTRSREFEYSFPTVNPGISND